MAIKRSGLGRGLDVLIRDTKGVSEKKNTEEKTDSKPVVEVTEKRDSKSVVKAEDENDKKTEKKAEKKADKKTEKKPVKKTTSAAKKTAEATKKVGAAKATEAKKAASKKTTETKDPAEAKKPAEDKAKAVEKEVKKEISAAVKAGEMTVRLSLVEPNRDQPRKMFDDAAIQELADSIRQYGVIQPLLVQVKGDHYEIIAGERRWRACQLAGLKEIPVIVRDYSEQQAVEVSIIENIQREDLNAIEEARAYRNLMNDFSMNQEEVARKVSKSRAAVANSMRLLKLDERVQGMLISRQIQEGHARALLGIDDGDQQLSLAEKIANEKMSVRKVEQMIRDLGKIKQPKKAKTMDPQRAAILEDLTEKMKKSLGTKVSIKETGKNKGSIEIEYYSDDELEAIYEILMRAGGER